jgi:hypothetical protein
VLCLVSVSVSVLHRWLRFRLTLPEIKSKIWRGLDWFYCYCFKTNISNVSNACRNNMQSPIISSSFNLKTEENQSAAASRKKAKFYSLLFLSDSVHHWLIFTIIFHGSFKCSTDTSYWSLKACLVSDTTQH